jgi:uncharacterized protein YlxW (UPF0749 family)
MTQRQQNFWNNWDFKTILVVLQLIGVIWLVATTYSKLEARVESNRLLLNQEVGDIQDDIRQIKLEVHELHNYLLKQKSEK